MKKLLANLLLLSFSLLISLLMVEFGLRLILFSQLPGLEKLRNPDLYADYFSEDDYWKLHYLWEYEPPPETIFQPHPILGWINDRFSPDTYLHVQAQAVAGRRPVLLYGDSFAACAQSEACFEDLLNNDPQFSQDHYLLNYGVGGYGLDQIYLLLQKSVSLYEDPLVVVGLMTFDLDRSLLSLRPAPKPSFAVANHALVLKHDPLAPHTEAFIEENPLQIRSYLYRFLIYLKFWPAEIAHPLRGTDQFTREKKLVNEKILLQTVQVLESQDLDFLFLVFHPHLPGVSTLDAETDWRDPFLRDLFAANGLPYLWSKDLVQQDSAGQPIAIDRYILPDNGHPTTYFNQLIADQLKALILETNQ